METVWLISDDDKTPDRIRGGCTRDGLIVSRSPGRTNMSNEERDEGWLGQTGDRSLTALGRYESFDDLVKVIHESGFPDLDADALRAWCEDDDVEDDYEIGPECGENLVISGPAGTITLQPDPEGGYSMDGIYDVPAPGWIEYAWYGDPMGWEPCPDPIDHSDRRNWDMDDIAQVLDAAGVEYDRLAHSEGTSSNDAWEFDGIYVRDENVEAANSALSDHIARDDRLTRPQSKPGRGAERSDHEPNHKGLHSPGRNFRWERH